MGSLQTLWAMCPAGARFVCAAYPATAAALTLLGGVRTAQLVFPPCSFNSVVGMGYLWAVPLSILHRPLESTFAVLIIFFEIYMALLLFPLRERLYGSAAFLCWLMVTSMMVTLVYLLLSVVLSNKDVEIQGLWPMVMVAMTLRSLEKPDDLLDIFGLLQVANKWYPIFFLAFCSLISGRVLWELVAALIVGFLHIRLKLETLVVGRPWVAALERCFCSRPCSRGLGGVWVPAGGSPLGSADMEGGSSGFVFSRGHGSGAPREPDRNAFRTFQGAGHRLGSS